MDFPADPVLTIKSTVIVLSDQVLFERADLFSYQCQFLWCDPDGVLR